MKDQLGSMERAAEMRYAEKEQPDGKIKCDCGKTFDPLTQGGPISPHPYSDFVCDECLSKMIEES